jgi:hypothetical protein
MKSAVIILSMFLAAAPGLALAGKKEKAEDAAIDQTLKCREIADAAARLACLDEGAKKLFETRIIYEDDESADARASDDQNVVETEEQFGSERIAAERKKRDSTRLKSIDAAIAEIRVRSNQKVTLTLDNGQKWRQLDSDDRVLHFNSKKKLFTAKVKRGALGNYMLWINEMKRSIRVERVE